MALVTRLSPSRLRPGLVLVAALAVVAGSYVVAPGLGRPTTPASAGHAAGAQAAPGSSAAPAPPAAVPAPGSNPGSSGGSSVGASIGSAAQLTKAIGIWSANVRANDRDFISATNLGLIYHARGRLTGNLDDYQRALDAARLAAKINPGDPSARSLEATVQAGLHDFAGALATAGKLYADDPTQLGALATMGDAQLELGSLAEATATYGRLAALTTGPAIDARLARLAYLVGDPARAVTLARRALDTAATAAKADGDAAPGDLVFYHYQLAEMARLTGDGTLARAQYAAALVLRPADLGSLVGLARVSAHDGDAAAARAGLAKAAAIAPQPETLALLGDLEARAGDHDAAAAQYATVRAVRQLSDLAGSVYDRQLLLFELDHGGATAEVLAQSRAALADRHDAYGHDVVAWAFYRLGRFDEAQAEIDQATASGVRDARLLAHAGAIAVARGDAVHGRALLREALALGPALDPAATDEAQRLLAGG